MRLGSLEFRPTLLPTLALLVVLPVLLSLGRWQLGRASEKEVLLATFDAAREAPALSVAALPTGDGIDEAAWARLQYRDIRLQGTLDGRRQLLLDNRVYRHRAGFEALTPLQLADGRSILVNRGWVPLGASREVLPDVALPERMDVALSGVLVRPSRAFALGDALAGDRGGWPRVLQYYDFTVLAALLGVDLVPGVVYLHADQPDVLTHTWRPLPEGPEKHYSYATQWFAMAGVVLILYFTLNTRRWRRGEPDRD